MRSWQLRLPAAGLRKKILKAGPASPGTRWLWGCLAPAMACLLLSLLAANRGGDNFGSKPMLGMVLSNQSYVAYASSGSQTAQNHLATVTFDSTNRSGIQSIIGFTPTTNFSN